MKSLVLSLGHNSSAILIEDGKILGGYEEERLSGIKSDSSFPRKSILRLMDLFPIPKNVVVCVSHWFLDGHIPPNNKYWDSVFLRENFPKCEVRGLNAIDFTHHDAHMESAEVFAGTEFPQDHHTFVVDGFGTDGECYSVYHTIDGVSTLIHRIHGFHRSIGLFYQYATDFCGMKMHQDEWKMLGYETHLNEFVLDDSNLRELQEVISEYSYRFSMGSDHKETNLDDLKMTREWTRKDLKDAIGGDETSYEKRVRIAYFVQQHTENVLRRLFNDINPTNLLVTGGVFFNVKLNSMLANMTPGRFCAMPLAGDQGAGLGVYQHFFHDLKWPGHLSWGNRDPIYSKAQGLKRGGRIDIWAELNLHSVVNVIRGSMEFGPRSLCNTSTLALPTMYNVDLINKMNGRNTVMPFALVVTRKQAEDLFEDTDKVCKSLEYMIVTRTFRPGKHVGLEGGALYYPLTDIWTCRPQITDDPLIVSLLKDFGPLINTSANVHGQPIVWNQKQIEFMHTFQRNTYPITTVLVVD
jgi:predicted NodU family carbamoyl transferase